MVYVCNIQSAAYCAEFRALETLAEVIARRSVCLLLPISFCLFIMASVDAPFYYTSGHAPQLLETHFSLGRRGILAVHACEKLKSRLMLNRLAPA